MGKRASGMRTLSIFLGVTLIASNCFSFTTIEFQIYDKSILKRRYCAGVTP